MKKNVYFILVVILSVLNYGCESSLQKGTKSSIVTNSEAINNKSTEEKIPLNLSVFLDMSDRIIKVSDGMVQYEKDLELVKYVTKYFQELVNINKIQKSKDKIHLFFYPIPNIPEINSIAKNLDIDFGIIPRGAPKKEQAINLPTQVDKALTQIYETTLENKNWIGSDIWGFFEDKAKDLCIKSGYRNVLIILSDGYIFYENNKQKKGSNYSYITSQTLNTHNSGLIPCSHSDFDTLEVLFLEINAPVKHSARIETVIGEWFKNMNIKKYKIVKTDIPANTTKIISSFMN